MMVKYDGKEKNLIKRIFLSSNDSKIKNTHGKSEKITEQKRIIIIFA